MSENEAKQERWEERYPEEPTENDSGWLIISFPGEKETDSWWSSHMPRFVLHQIVVDHERAGQVGKVRYLPLECPICGRMRLEYWPLTDVVKCEKCGADTEVIGNADSNYAKAGQVDGLRKALEEIEGRLRGPVFSRTPVENMVTYIANIARAALAATAPGTEG